jgi:hypothetical protein
VVQQTLCAEKTPTLGNVVPQFELFMSSLEVLGSQSEELRPITDVGIKWATKYYQRMDDSRVLEQRFPKIAQAHTRRQRRDGRKMFIVELRMQPLVSGGF